MRKLLLFFPMILVSMAMAMGQVKCNPNWVAPSDYVWKTENSYTFEVVCPVPKKHCVVLEVYSSKGSGQWTYLTGDVAVWKLWKLFPESKTANPGFNPNSYKLGALFVLSLPK